MTKLLIVVDVQNDFITGTLGTHEAELIVPNVKRKIDEYKRNGDEVVFTQDTHFANYLSTQEGRNLPVMHCIDGTQGHKIAAGLDTTGAKIVKKSTFGSLVLAQQLAASGEEYDEIEICGLCTDICVVTNALIIKTQFPETPITLDATCCAGATVEGHKAALTTMKACQIHVINEEQ